MRASTDILAASPSTIPPGNGDPTVLVVQNEPYLSAVLWALLSGRGFRVVCENSGPVGAELARSLSPDVVVLDVNLPEMNGLEICRQLKADAELSSMPVIFCSGQHYLADEALELGAAAFLSVPGEVFKLPESVRAVLRVRGEAR
jgi:two-component system phosphate regulon response regulator PhoB